MDRSAKTLPQKTIKKTLALGFPRRLSGQDKPPTSRPAYTQKFVLSRFNYLKSHFFNRLYWGAPLLKVTPASPPPRPPLRRRSNLHPPSGAGLSGTGASRPRHQRRYRPAARQDFVRFAVSDFGTRPSAGDFASAASSQEIGILLASSGGIW